MSIAFVQPFSFGDGGGGPRIYRMLADDAPIAARSYTTQPAAIEHGIATAVPETHLPGRPSFGRLEATRFRRHLSSLETLLSSRLQQDLSARFRQDGVERVNGLAHSVDFAAAHEAARALGLPFFLTVHDDLRYALRGTSRQRWAERRLESAWQSSRHRFVISNALGEEYDRRYGTRRWTVITDGISSFAERSPRPAGTLRLYFMGSLHRSYIANFQTCVRALEALVASGTPAVLTLRGSALPAEIRTNTKVEQRPLAPEEVISGDFDDADVAYLPLPFGEEHRDFLNYSLPTKLISYLAGGRPIVYHGPSGSTTDALLRDHDAGIRCHHLEDAAALGAAIGEARARGDQLVRNGRKLGKLVFDRPTLRSRFWTQVLA